MDCGHVIGKNAAAAAAAAFSLIVVGGEKNLQRMNKSVDPFDGGCNIAITRDPERQKKFQKNLVCFGNEKNFFIWMKIDSENWVEVKLGA